MNKLIAVILVYLLCIESVFAGLPPTSAKGQSESSAATTFFFQAPYNQATTTAGVTRLLETGNQNLLVNPSFEATTFSTGWTCATFSCIVETTNIADGLKAGEVVNANSANTVISQSVTPTILLTGRNLMASMNVRTNIAGFQVCALVAGAEVQCISVPAVSNYVNVQVPFTATSGQSVGVSLKSTDTNAKTVFWDQAYVGIIPSSYTMPDTAYASAGALTITGSSSNPTKGTTSIDRFLWYRQGANLIGRIEYNQTTGGTAGSGAYRILIPTSIGCTVDTSVVSTYSGTAATASTSSVGAGHFIRAANLYGDGNVVLVDSTHVSFTVADATGGDDFVSSSYHTLSAADEGWFANFTIPCANWGPTNTVSTATTDASWSGYHDNTCSWARTNVAYGDPTADTTCTLTERVNQNFGSVTSYLSGSDKLPGIVFTPPRTGKIRICANPKIAGSSLAAFLDLKLWDGTTTIGEAEDQSQVATDLLQVAVCGIYTISSLSAVTISLQSKATAGSITIAANSTNASAVEWSMFYIDQGLPNPLLTNSISTNYAGVSTFDTGRFTISNSASAIVSQSGGWTIANGASAGLSTITFVPTYSAEPHCSCTLIGAASTSASGCWFTAISSSSLSVTRLRAGAAESGDVEIQCRGNK